MQKEGVKIKAYKDKQYIIFDFEDGQTVQYDLATKKTIGKRGKEVKDLRSQLRGYSIEQVINSFDNTNYQNFLRFVRHKGQYDIFNAGSLIERAKQYSRYEQYFSAGIKELDSDIKPSITEIPNGLLRLCKKYEVRLSNNLYNCYKSNPDFFTIAFDMEFISLTSSQIFRLLTYGYYMGRYNKVVTPSYLHTLHKDYNYNIKSLLTYFDNLYTYEAIEDIDYMIREFLDYVKMMSRISPKYDKYPKNFLTTHKIAVRNYNRLKEQFIEEDFKKRIDKSLEYSLGKYQIVYPKTTQEIKDEAVQQNHCVASYIKRVIDGDCHILFLRKKESLDKSLITLEIRDSKVVQARGKFNREPSEEELNIIDKFNQKIERLAMAC